MRYPKAGGTHGKTIRYQVFGSRAGPAWIRAGFDNAHAYSKCERSINTTIDELQYRFGTEVRATIKPGMGGSWAYTITGELTLGMNGIAWYVKNGYKEYATLQYMLGLRHRRGEWPRKVHGYFADPVRAGRILAGHEYAHVLCDKILERSWTHQVPYQLVYARVLDYLFPGFGATHRVYRRHGRNIDLRYPQVDERVIAKLDRRE